MKEWVPVFLSPKFSLDGIHIVDYFAGPGKDGIGNWGSPLRIIGELINMSKATQTAVMWPKRRFYLHFYDKNAEFISLLKENIHCEFEGKIPSNVIIEIKCKPFEESFSDSLPILRSSSRAKLLFIDQFGVLRFGSDKYLELSRCPMTDFILFMSSSYIHRFYSIRKKFEERGLTVEEVEDYRKIHIKTVEAYKKIETEKKMYIGSFAFRKQQSNVYGIIFFSPDPLGIHKFLKLCWKNDSEEGMADFPVYELDVPRSQSLFTFAPNRKENLKEEFHRFILSIRPKNELEIAEFCYDRWMDPSLCASVLIDLKNGGIIDIGFRVPQPNSCRPVKYLK